MSESLMSVCACSEALPFFLLLVDLSKACTLAKYALSSLSQVLTSLLAANRNVKVKVVYSW